MSESDIQPMPEIDEMHTPVAFGKHLDGVFFLNRDRPTLYFAVPGGKEQLGRLDPFPVNGTPRGHYHVNPKKVGGDQMPFKDDDSELTIFELALRHMRPAEFKDILAKAGAVDIAEEMPNEVIIAAAEQYRQLYEHFPV